MYEQRGHVSSEGIGIIFGLGLALSVVLEIPTGIIADKLSRKYVLLFSLFLKVLALFTWITMPYFTGYLLAATLFALSEAFESGTLQAYLYGALDSDNKRNFAKYWSRVSAMIMFSYTMAYIFTTILGINYSLLLILSIVPCLLALLVGLSLPLDKVAATSIEVKPKVLASAVSHIKDSPQLFKLIVGGVVIVALAEVMIEYSSLYYHQVGVGVRFIPLIMAGGNILGAISFWSLHHWNKTLNKWQLPLLSLFCLFFALTFFGGTIAAVAGALLFTRYIRLLQVQYESTIQHLANDQARATISSIGSFGSAFLGGVIMILVGLLAINNSVVRPIRIFLIGGALIYFVIQLGNKYKSNHLSAIDAADPFDKPI